MSDLARIRDFVFAQPWAIHEPMLEVIAEIVEGHIAGRVNPAVDLKNKAATEETQIRNGIAIVPIHGVIMQRAGMFENISGGVSYPTILKNFQAAMDSPAKVVLLDVDSPGGEAFGCEEAAETIYNARGKKLMLAFTDRNMTSAAYWLACQADFVFSTRDAEVGSIGVVANVPDGSRMEKNLGLDRRILRSGPNKAIGAGAVTEEQLQQVRERVEQFANSFWSSVSRARGIELSADIKSGRTWTGVQAVETGLVDETVTFAELMAKYGTP